MRDSWIEGGETDVERLEEEWRLPTFWGLRICVTGFDDRELIHLKRMEESRARLIEMWTYGEELC